MAIFRQGISTSIGTQVVSNITNNAQSTSPNQQNLNYNNVFLPVRVTDIILNEKHPKFVENGEANGIGTIFYETIGLNEKSTGFAYPFDPHFKTFPLANEIVLLILIPSKFTNDIKNQQIQSIYYYLNPIGIWNHPHHNASPKLDPKTSYNSLPANQQNDYDKTDAGYVRRVDDDDSTEINLNYLYYPNPSQSTFKEKVDLHPLLPFMGDTIFEGRWGNSLRFGSTSKFSSKLPLEQIPSIDYQNNWSDVGNNGDPITILRNGQPQNHLSRNNIELKGKGWIPITENIKNDLSSIYLTSYQKIPFSIANENFICYTTPPISPSQYSNPQIILSSDRITLNAKNDSVLISGEKSVGLSSNESINIEAKQIYLNGNDIRLGNKNASQHILKGDDTVTYLKILITELKNLTEVLKTVQNWPGGVPTPNPALLTVANSSQKIFEKVYNNIDSIKSNFVKTI